MHITDWSITPDSNASVNGLDISQGAPARNVGGALRAIMAGVKAAADESGEAEQFFADHPSYLVSGKGGYLLDIAPSAAEWGDYLTALAKDYAAADRGALRIPYTAQRMCHVLTFSSGTEVTVYIPSQRLIRAYTYSTGEWADTGAETVPEALRRLSLVETTFAPLASPALTGAPTAPTAAPETNTTQIATTAFVQASEVKVMASVKNNDALVVHLTGDETISGTKTFIQTIAGTADAAAKLATARTITLSGAASGSVSFDGSADATLEVSIGGNQGAVIGEIRWFAMFTPPEGWLVCNGASVLISDYPALYNAIGTLFLPKGSVPASPVTSFNLPNLIGKVPWGSTSVGTVLDAGLPDIAGYVNNDLSVGIYGTAEAGQLGGAFYTGATTTWFPIRGNNTDGTQHVGFGFSASRSNSIYGNSSTVQPPALCLLPCIRYE